MPLWSDNFNRADGPMGSDWVVKAGGASISSNTALLVGQTSIVAGPVSGPGSAMAECKVTLQDAVTFGGWPCVKIQSDGNSGYYAQAYHNGSDTIFTIRSKAFAWGTALASYTWVGHTPATGTIRLVYSGGVLYLYWDGTLMVQVSDSSYAANPAIGLWSYGNPIAVDDFSASGDGSPALFVSPPIVGTDDGDQLLSIQGQAVTWTVGVPGSPTFSVNAGALSGQSITSTQTATAIFSPPATAQTVTLLDSTDGISATITVVAGTYLGGGGAGPGGLPTAVVDWLAAQAAHGGLVLADNDQTEGEVAGVELKGAFGSLLLGVRSGNTPTSPNQAIADIILTLWDILNGSLPHESESDVFQTVLDIASDVTALREKWLTGNPPTEYTVLDILGLLGGSPVANHQDILTAIAGISGGDNQDVLDAIAAMQGDPLATIKAVLDLVYALGTTSNYDLQDVLDAVAAVRGTGSPDLAAVSSKLTAIQPSTGVTLSTIQAKTVAESVIQSIVDAGVLAIAGEEGATIAAALDLLNQIKDLLPGGGTAGAPVWPGADFVTLGTAVALVDGMTITGPMDGVLIAITGQPPHAHSYPFGSVESWSHVGQLLFFTDNGDYERAESFGLDTQILTPKTMEQAAGCVIRLNAGWTGTVQPWVREA